MTKIEITKAIFKCQADENIFYQRLSEVTGIKNIVSHDSHLSVSISLIKKRQTIADIAKICDIWHVSFNIK